MTGISEAMENLIKVKTIYSIFSFATAAACHNFVVFVFRANESFICVSEYNEEL